MVSVADLIGARLFAAGEQIVSVVHEGDAYTADLTGDGHIHFQGAVQPTITNCK